MSLPSDLGDRGKALWEALGQKAGTPAGELALEACRTADRLEHIDKIILGKDVLNLLTFRLDLDLRDDDLSRQINVRVGFSDVMAEARQQQMAFKQILASLGFEKASKVEPERPRSALDELENRRAGRRKGPSDKGRASGN